MENKLNPNETESNSVYTRVKNWLEGREYNPEIFEPRDGRFGFRFERTGTRMRLIKEDDAILIDALFLLGEDAEDLYDEEVDSEFENMITRYLPILQVDVANLEGSRYVVYDRIYDDSFTFGALYDCIKRVSHAGWMLHSGMRSIVDSREMGRSVTKLAAPEYYQ